MFFIGFVFACSGFSSLGPRWVCRSYSIERVYRWSALAAFAGDFGARCLPFWLGVKRVSVCLVSVMGAAAIGVFVEGVMGGVIRKVCLRLFIRCAHLL